MNLGFLRPLYQETGGYISVYLDTSRAHENAPEAVGLRWRGARERLAAEGADAATLEAAEEAVTSSEAAAPGRAVFARAGTVVFTAALPAPPRREISRLAPLPHLLPLLAQQPPQPPHLRVAATRAGGEIVAVTGGREVWAGHAQQREWPVHKTGGGGWSQARHQRSVEEAWEENAGELAAQVTEAAGRIQARQVIVAGDARARQLLLRHLGNPLRESAAEVDQEVAADSEAMANAAWQILAARAEQECRERFEVWRSQLARGAGTEGLPGTLTALADGQVSELFLADRPTSTAAAWVGPAGTELAASERELRERGVPGPVQDRADAAIVCAVATTDATLRFLPEDLVVPAEPDGIAHPRDGSCATLRYSAAG